MKLFKKTMLTTPLLTTACVAVPLSSCSTDDKNSVYWEGASQIFNTKYKWFTLTLYLQYILEGNTKIVLKMIDTKEGSTFTFNESYTKYNLVGRQLEFKIDFECQGTVGEWTTFNVEVYGVKKGQTIWSSKIQGFELVITNK